MEKPCARTPQRTHTLHDNATCDAGDA